MIKNKKTLKDYINEVLGGQTGDILLAKPSTEHEMAKKLFEQESKLGTSDMASEVAFNTMTAATVFGDGSLNEDLEDISGYEFETSAPGNTDEEVIDRFYESLYSGKRSGYLTYYSRDELAQMHLYLLKGHKAGFALKDGNDIVSVHNNSDIRGLGKFFMETAKSVGGTKLDHFDGFLSGLYRKNGFVDVYEIYQWDETYRPSAWNYDPVDIFSPTQSVYADWFSAQEVGSDPSSELPNEEMTVTTEGGLQLSFNPRVKFLSYKYGRPDVIMRRMG
tara:strand:+ start:10456 stop:11283 length:828 start_codon:yes stop_codon:yes gene_type:complete